MDRYVVKVGNRTTEYPDLTRSFRTEKRAVIHAIRVRRGQKLPTRVIHVKDGDKVLIDIPFADAA